MLEHRGLPDEAKSVQTAIERTTASGVATRDIGGSATTDEMTEQIIAHLPAEYLSGTGLSAH